jgi:hypothetical protein
MRRVALLLAVAGVTALLAGCGSSNKSLSYSGFSNAADKICQTVTSQTKAAGQLTATPNAANAKIISKVVSAADSGIGKLKALKGPSALETARDAFVATVQQETNSANAMISAAKAGNESGYVSAAQQLNGIDQQSNLDGSKLGAPDCAKG